jgi:hypothetical protein
MPAMPTALHDPDCLRCTRLADFLDGVRAQRADYFAAPVPSFGAPHARLLIVGLAPGMHGANRSGRPFTGDYAGLLLYETLHKFGYASAPQSVSVDDGLVLEGCRITNAVKCLPPANKPEPAEIRAGTARGAWGRYYDAEPWVMAGDLALGMTLLRHTPLATLLDAHPEPLARLTQALQ